MIQYIMFFSLKAYYNEIVTHGQSYLSRKTKTIMYGYIAITKHKLKKTTLGPFWFQKYSKSFWLQKCPFDSRNCLGPFNSSAPLETRELLIIYPQ